MDETQQSVEEGDRFGNGRIPIREASGEAETMFWLRSLRRCFEMARPLKIMGNFLPSRAPYIVNHFPTGSLSCSLSIYQYISGFNRTVTSRRHLAVSGRFSWTAIMTRKRFCSRVIGGLYGEPWRMGCPWFRFTVSVWCVVHETKN